MMTDRNDVPVVASDDRTKSERVVHEYMQKIYQAAKALAQTLDDVDMEIDENTEEEKSSLSDTNALVDKIAETLVEACHPRILSLSTSHLPPLNIFHCDTHLMTSFLEKEQLRMENKNFTTRFYQHRRSDYLRRLLRLMAPISMNVCAAVLSKVLSSRNQEDSISTILLLSHWLPVAPHLTQICTEFFELIPDPGLQFLAATKLIENEDITQQRVALVVVESLFELCTFLYERVEIRCLSRLGWNWSFVFSLLHRSHADTNMTDANNDEITDICDCISYNGTTALQWYCFRILSLLMNWSPGAHYAILEKWSLEQTEVPWRIHSWEVDEEELQMENTYLTQQSLIWDDASTPLTLPTSSAVQLTLRPSPFLSTIGDGIIFYVDGSLRELTVKSQPHRDNDDASMETLIPSSSTSQQSLVPTATTCSNMSLLGTALCELPHPPPILICGPHGSGKSALVREMLRLCRPKESLVEFYIDDETDSKTLIGSYTSTDIPGEITWRAGALTNASREGRWILFEEFDTVPVEIQAALVKLLEDRMLPIGNGKYERCHPNFRIFGTCTTDYALAAFGARQRNLRLASNRGGGRRILNLSYWRKVHVDPLPFDELRQVAKSLYPQVPDAIIDSSMIVFESLDQSGRNTSDEDAIDQNDGVGDTSPNVKRIAKHLNSGRNPSVRDLFKLLSRISNGIFFEKGAAFATEAQRTLCMAESVDVFVGSCPDQVMKNRFVELVAAPAWKVTKALALQYLNNRMPELLSAPSHVEIGRVKIDVAENVEFRSELSAVFAMTGHTMRFMESLAVCVRQNEPALLVGETGCGKTSLIQQLANHCERTLVVQNLSLQTDSTDLLGGYRPLEMSKVARQVYCDFVETFVASFSRKQNEKFLQYAASMLEKENWKKLSLCFQRASKLGLDKVNERIQNENACASNSILVSWEAFAMKAERFENQRLSCAAGLAFEFAEGALVEAIQDGKWVLLDEINLASSDTLQRLCGLLDDPYGSLTLLERGDSKPIVRHPMFRLFAAMNPATDVGKKDLPPSIRSRFSELYVNELLDPIELRLVAAQYLHGVLPSEGKSPEHTEIVVSLTDLYLKCRGLAETSLSDGNGHKPRYTLRTLSRALSAAKALVVQQRISLRRAMFEGFQLAFVGTLDSSSAKSMKRAMKRALLDMGPQNDDLDHPGRRPGGKNNIGSYILVRPFWIPKGSLEPRDWAEIGPDGKSRFILTPSALDNLRRLSCALAAGPWPVLLEGPTSSGKTTLVEYMAARCGHHVVRINNHEHTDVQEYTGSFASDPNGSLSFRDGILVRALRQGHWVILDELNLAPSEVLEALNRLLDDNRELYLAETNEIVKPHPNFRLFATQNPSGIYGGRKPLSRAFRNRFMEFYIDDIPNEEMIQILEKRCGCPPSHANQLVKIMIDLRQKRSKSNVFLGKDSFITPRDLLRWAERHSGSKKDLAEHGYKLLAERLRSDEEKDIVRDIIEEHTRTRVDMENLYYGEESDSRKLLAAAVRKAELRNDRFVASIAPTRSLLRLIHLVMDCIEKKEPVLLVGETGCGKTTVIQLLSFVLDRELFSVNCHATTDTSDLIGGLRPIRRKNGIKKRILLKLQNLIDFLPSGEIDLESIFDGDLDKYDVDALVGIARSVILQAKTNPAGVTEQCSKRRKLHENSSPKGKCEMRTGEGCTSLEKIGMEIENLWRQAKALFEWNDGPLVEAMKGGHLMLLDEMSLAEDAVLERLNSVLEPSRLLVLAEKGETGMSDAVNDERVIYAHEDFRIFATMNPGGDFGKRELSPALRSRFTEIWVPSVIVRSDLEVVLSRSLTGGLDQSRILDSSLVMHKILDYVEWFNGKICRDPNLCAGYDLSLRDVLSWCHFIVESQSGDKHIGLWDAFFHGACLMHLDGLGLGSGLSPESSAILKAEAEKVLLSSLADTNISNLRGVEKSFGMHNGKFGTIPYFIDVGRCILPKPAFDMKAPTTAQNVFRVLRAMQLKKPILLEGAPGVGKTSVVVALAAASDHKLVRINLSDQTDMSDLMGSDLPSESSTAGPDFKWCDGVLLTAIKEGSWVLLDELNLASQAVLEGLNSCLDHRGSVYIPELGKTFECPSSFRVFGAQNPLGQGGGRKGLPKSFLNRFTKVFVDSLTNSDFESILTTQFKDLSPDFVSNAINFNNQVQEDFVHLRKYGSDGGPWEFNLRDIFRWSQLLSGPTTDEAGAVRNLYYQRFRCTQDRDRIDEIFQMYFGSPLTKFIPPQLRISKASLRIGDITLSRHNALGANRLRAISATQRDAVFFSHLSSMEAVVCCIQQQWPCLLVGSSQTGKTSIVSALADMCNATLVEQTLSPSSDVTELLGAFEQVDRNAEENAAVEDVCDLARQVILSDGFSSSEIERCWNHIIRLENRENAVSGASKSEVSMMSLAEHLLDDVLRMIGRLSNFAGLREQIEALKQRISLCISNEKSKQPGNGGFFEWRDGILVEAMMKGYWIVLENANLCPASVLDRLNSVTESNGSLLLTESGFENGQESDHGHRLITPHRNFRIFLTMDPSNGEISRAMRNRCVEISLLEHTLDAKLERMKEVQTCDVLGHLRGVGVRSLDVASDLMATYCDERVKANDAAIELPRIKCPIDVGRLLSAMRFRGIAYSVSSGLIFRLSYESNRGPSNSRHQICLVARVPLPEFCFRTQHPQAVVLWDRRLLRSFVQKQKNEASFLELCSSLELFKRFKTCMNLELCFDDETFDRNIFYWTILKLFLIPKSLDEVGLKALSFEGLQSKLSVVIGSMAAELITVVARQDATDATQIEPLVRLVWERLPQAFAEKWWAHCLLGRDVVLESFTSMSVLDVSFYIRNDLLDGSTIPCVVTRTVYPFFLALDEWLASFLCEMPSLNKTMLWTSLFAFLDERDKLWTLLKMVTINPSSEGPTSFDSTEFIVQWNWLRKKMSFDLFGFPRRLVISVESIDTALFGDSIAGHGLSKIKKRQMSPLTPKRTDEWQALLALNSLSNGIALSMDHRLDPFGPLDDIISLQTLMDEVHPCLYVTEDESFRILAAVSTFQLVWTQWAPRDQFSELDFEKSLSQSFKELRDRFVSSVAAARVDRTIQTVDNQLETSVLNDLAACSHSTVDSLEAFHQLKDRLFGAYSKIQVSVLFEYWCATKERALCGELSRILLKLNDDKSIKEQISKLSPDLERFVHTAVSMTTWNVNDMSTYQLILWAATGKNSMDNMQLWQLIRSLMPKILLVSLDHLSRGAFVCGNIISDELGMPDMNGNGKTNSTKPHLDRCLPLFGSARLRQPVRSQFMLQFIGKQFSFLPQGAAITHLSIENATYRTKQSRSMLKYLSSYDISISKSNLYAFHFVLFDILSAVREVYGGHEMDRLLHAVKCPENTPTSDMQDMLRTGDKVRNEFFQLYWSELLSPLMDSLFQAWERDVASSDYEQQYSLISIYLGLLRLHLLIPDSPLDPGLASIAKMSLLSREMAQIKAKLAANALYSGFTDGNFNPQTDDVIVLDDKLRALAAKKESLKEKVVERAPAVPHFFDLFREINNFKTNALKPVLSILRSIKSNDDVEKLQPQIQNWQSTAAAFCRRIRDTYCGYEDVFTSIVESIHLIQNGLCGLNNHTKKNGNELFSSVVRDLCCFPMALDTVSIARMRQSARSFVDRPGTDESNSGCYVNIIFAALGRLYLKQTILGLDDTEILEFSDMLTEIDRSGIVDFDEDTGIEATNVSLEELREMAFREQFPDHRKDFEDVVKGKCFDGATPNDQEETSPSLSQGAKSLSLTEKQVALIYRMYMAVFAEGEKPLADNARKLAFHCSYASAHELTNVSDDWLETGSSGERVGGHVLAIALSMSTDKENIKAFSYLSETIEVIDFQNEACPFVALSAAKPIEGLMARTTQLLTAFPGHTILHGLWGVCEKVNKLNLVTTPIGKIMTGIEVVLRQAQEWEQHASEKVQLGSPLKEIGRLVTKWRKLELECCNKLFNARKKRFIDRARTHWGRLRGILRSQTGSFPERQLGHNTNLAIAPGWVWKGLTNIQKVVTYSFDAIHLYELKEVVKALDTFILTSSLGEFEERLKILKTLSVESFQCYRISRKRQLWDLQQARVLHSVWQYYCQYSSQLCNKLNVLARPLEEKMKNETKLSTWDTQTYYSLAESTEKNKRNVIRILSEFDEVLQLNVGQLIEEETCEGLRSSVDSYDEYCATFPPQSVMFPLENLHQEQLSKFAKQERLSPATPHDLIELNEDFLRIVGAGDHARSIGRYARKMNALASTSKTLRGSRGRRGGDLASSFCDAIFDRIEGLRGKSTRPMKERALLDLLRHLKRNGFATTKWSTPREVKAMEQLFLLPAPAVSNMIIGAYTSDRLERAEMYFIKSVAEVHSLSSESTVLGSKYMTKREIELMVNLSYSGMSLLTQQRSLLSKLSEDLDHLQNLIDLIPSSNAMLPFNQSSLLRLVECFRTLRRHAMESVCQVTLLLRSISSSIEISTKEKEWVRDAIVKLESISREIPTDCIKALLFATEDQLTKVKKDVKGLENMKAILNTCRAECEAICHIPVEPFDTSLRTVEQAIEAGLECDRATQVCRETSNDSDSDKSHFTGFSDHISLAIERALVTYQNISKEMTACGNSEICVPIEDEEPTLSIGECHMKFMTSLAVVDHRKLILSFSEALQRFRDICDIVNACDDEVTCCWGLLSNTRVLLVYIQELSKRLLDDAVHFYFSTAKLNYVTLRVFRVLVAKGYCSEKTSEGDDAEGDVSGMNFEDDHDGTGLGSGDGKKDITDQLENEDQLSGLKSDRNNEKGDDTSNEKNELNEEEAEQGMEMEMDFDGEMFDMPDQPKDQEREELEDDEEELNREMGDDINDNDQVVDEKMWDENDDENEIKDNEKFEQDGRVEGEAIEDAIRTREDEIQEDGGPHSKEERENRNDKNEGDENIECETESNINDDLDDQYEEAHGIDVREKDEEVPQEEEPDQQLNLFDDINLDDEEHEPDETPANEADKDEAAMEDGDEENAEEVAADDRSGTQSNVDSETENVNPIGSKLDIDDREDDTETDDDTGPAIEKSMDDQINEAHGIQAKDGTDAIAEESDVEDQGDKGYESSGNPSSGKSQGAQSHADGGGGEGHSNEATETNEQLDAKQTSYTDFPNPMKDPGDAMKFWHRRLNLFESSNRQDDNLDQVEMNDSEAPQELNGGDFQYASGPSSTTQVLGEATEEEAVELEPERNEQKGDNEKNAEQRDKEDSNTNSQESMFDKTSSRREIQRSLSQKDDPRIDDVDEPQQDDSDLKNTCEDLMDLDETEEEANLNNDDGEDEEDLISGTQVVSDMSKLRVDQNEGKKTRTNSTLIQQDEYEGRISDEKANDARKQWLAIHGETQSLARRLCEKVRLVLEPMVKSKLRGDYRTGKRINMKRIIGYIASGYRKDKIWLRRTKPGKRDYKVLLAVDDSESMKKSGAGEMALRAMATVAIGMNQLEVGELGVASFGDDMKLIHPFHMPFTAESGIDAVQHFKFDQKRTRISLCVESAMAALQEAGDVSSMQLVFLISDGRIERDSRSTLKRLIREMTERNILLAMIIVEGKQKKKDSILNMKEVSFEKGKPVVKKFIEDYPFPYYIVLDDVTTLPEVLGDALKQWFEMLTQLQNTGM